MKKALFFILFSCNVAWASCDHLYPDSKPIEVPGTIELCKSFYVIRYNPKYMTPVLVSELLDPSKPIGKEKRLGVFKTDPEVPNGIKSSEYTNTGYDRGHMVPSDDAASKAEMSETFVTTNSTPQNSVLNQTSWRILEAKVRKMAIGAPKPVHIVTVATFPKRPSFIGRLPIPNGYWKVIPSKQMENGHFYNIAWFAENSSASDIRQYTNIDILKIASTLD